MRGAGRDPFDFERIADEALRQAERLVPQWIPAGEATDRGREWEAAGGGARGCVPGAGHGFKICLHTGHWQDFQGDDAAKGGDLISLRAYLDGTRQIEAARAIAAELGLEVADPVPAEPRQRKGRDQESDLTLLTPAPIAFPDRLLHRNRAGPYQGHWEYRDREGGLLMVVVRLWDEAKGEKTFRPYTCVQNAEGSIYWRSKGLPAPRPLYGLHLLPDVDTLVAIVVEGEKDCDALRRLVPPDWWVTSPPNGAKSPRQADWSPLAHFHKVLIWGDYDQAGTDYVGRVAKLLPSGPRRASVDPVSLQNDLGIVLGKGDGAADVEPQLTTDADREQFVRWLVDLAAPADAPEDAARGEGTGDAASKAGRTGRVASPVTPYQHLVTAICDHVEHARLWPDALAGWLDVDDNAVDIGDPDIIEEFAHTYMVNGGEYKDGELRVATKYLFRTWRQERRHALIQRITGTKPSDPAHQALRDWLQAICGEVRPLDEAVLRHWMWQVKRLALGMPIDWDIMPVLYSSQQGTGKTTALEILCSPLDELSPPVTAESITDERHAQVIIRALVGRWDEMTGASKGDQEAIKRAVTATTVAFRTLFTDLINVRKRTCSFFGTSNLPVNVIIADPSGNRRFYQMDAVPCDFDLMNSVDPTLIWSAVDHDDDAPILPHMDALRAHQEALLYQDIVSVWQEQERWGSICMRRADQDEPMILLPYSDDLGWPLEQIAARIAHFARGVGNPTPPIARLSTRLHQLRWTNRQIRVGKREENRRERRWFRPDKFSLASAETAQQSEKTDNFDADMRALEAEGPF